MFRLPAGRRYVLAGHDPATACHGVPDNEQRPDPEPEPEPRPAVSRPVQVLDNSWTPRDISLSPLPSLSPLASLASLEPWKPRLFPDATWPSPSSAPPAEPAPKTVAETSEVAAPAPDPAPVSRPEPEPPRAPVVLSAPTPRALLFLPPPVDPGSDVAANLAEIRARLFETLTSRSLAQAEPAPKPALPLPPAKRPRREGELWCSCTTGCLHGRCSCFRNSAFCGPFCQCNVCKNTLENASRVIAERQAKTSRGCVCRIGDCANNKCYCFRAQRPCDATCECRGCGNRPADRTLLDVRAALEMGACECTSQGCAINSPACRCVRKGIPCGVLCKCHDCQNSAALQIARWPTEPDGSFASDETKGPAEY